ncbi:hypothetical protein NEF87_002413 [Candidatus Lokiarchaeum ossiferum]|uniref:Nudix hydrolase domain-containing protein n=1 Tax=Candidatus Lokiarchaeum ossiferum TaxID=2951803 RepID=A0ABY6HS02_9ARCH|nr:hypothetical protein NEF87_002413 [Candidatus Lokiarchaeum sp. B-35]
MEIFGKKEAGIIYINRPGVYVIIQNELHQIAFVRTVKGLFLPGGGKEQEESDEECLLRECREELGWEIQIGKKIAETGEYFSSPHQGQYYFIQGVYYLGEKLTKKWDPIEDDHLLEWRSPKLALPQIYPQGQKWVIQQNF